MDKAKILKLIDEANDIVSALYRQGANKDYKCKSLREKLNEIRNELIGDSGDCFCVLKTANEQRENKSIWREQLQQKMWCKRRDEVIKAINELWMNDGSWVNIWEDWWFPGIDNFLNDLQQMGYHVYVGSAERCNNQGMTQRRYCVYLDELPDKKEWSRNAGSKTD